MKPTLTRRYLKILLTISGRLHFRGRNTQVGEETKQVISQNIIIKYRLKLIKNINHRRSEAFSKFFSQPFTIYEELNIIQTFQINFPYLMRLSDKFNYRLLSKTLSRVSKELHFRRCSITKRDIQQLIMMSRHLEHICFTNCSVPAQTFSDTFLNYQPTECTKLKEISFVFRSLRNNIVSPEFISTIRSIVQGISHSNFKLELTFELPSLKSVEDIENEDFRIKPNSWKVEQWSTIFTIDCT
ncbi:unnamed protein product [Moneuplotes crassus]|uniref:Uncharacterized protein n=1 Tax=Euplotes crassus TaxID=5936 RepID=A0AAD1XTV6_EUPCR|nr:unnamed protein product [Moneuplotes crassus]